MDKSLLNRTFTYEGATAAGILLLSNECLKISDAAMADWKVLLAAGAFMVGGILLDKLYKENKYEKLFRMCGIENRDKQVPVIIKKQTNGIETTLVIHLPAGISQKHFEAKQQELEQFLNAKIELGYNKNLIMELIDNNLKTEYKYVFEECDGPLKIYCAETNRGKFYLDIEKCPHILLAGETGSGKSTFLDTIILSLIQSKYNIDLHLIDFQSVGLGKYEKCKKVKSYGETPKDFKLLLDELEEENKRRIALFKSVSNKIYIDKLETWNKRYPERALPYKVIIVDEAARLAEKQYEDFLEQLRTRVQMDRKVGLHFLISLQRPSVDILQGSLKANLPCRLAFETCSEVDSKVILDKSGAEELKNPGRFIIKYSGNYTECQSLYIPSDNIFKFLKSNKLFKTPDEIQLEKHENMKKLRDKCINPYLKKEGAG